MQSCKEDLKRGKQQDDTLTSWTSQICTQAQMRQALTCGKLAVDVVLDAGMTGSAAADPLLLGASYSWASSCPLLVADGCVTGPASSSARFVEAEVADCSTCSTATSGGMQQSFECERHVTGHRYKYVK